MDDFLQMKKDTGKLVFLEKRLSVLRKDLDKLKLEECELKARYEKEKLDVIKMEKENIVTFFLHLTGKYHDRMEKRIQEEMDAKEALDNKKTAIKETGEEISEISSEIIRLKELSIEYEREVKIRREKLLNEESPGGEDFRRLEEEIDFYSQEAASLNHAEELAKKIIKTSESVLYSLKKAENWATFDVWTKGGIIAHMGKYSNMDQAQEKFGIIKSQIENLKNETNDIESLKDYKVKEISSSQRAIDFWFDNIFTNLSVRNQIRDNMESLSTLKRKIYAIKTELENKRKEIETELYEKESKQEQILASTK